MRKVFNQLKKNTTNICITAASAPRLCVCEALQQRVCLWICTPSGSVCVWRRLLQRDLICCHTHSVVLIQPNRILLFLWRCLSSFLQISGSNWSFSLCFYSFTQKSKKKEIFSWFSNWCDWCSVEPLKLLLSFFMCWLCCHSFSMERLA